MRLSIQTAGRARSELTATVPHSSVRRRRSLRRRRALETRRAITGQPSFKYQGSDCDRTEPRSGLGGPHDRRAAQPHAVHRGPRVSLVGYDADAGFQMRLEFLQLATSGLDGARRFAASSFGAPTPNGAPSRSSPTYVRRKPKMQGDHRHRWSGKGCGLGDRSISYPRALPASAAFRDPDRRSSRSSAR
jgi:hypothetical protein